MFTNVWRHLFSVGKRKPTRRARARAGLPRLEALEDRNLLSAGALDLTFGSGGLATAGFTGPANDRVADAAVQADGKILVAGSTAPLAGSNADFAVVRYNADGSLDSSFGNGGKVTIDLGGNDTAAGIAVQADGKIVVGGSTSPILGFNADFAVVRLNLDGSVDSAFGVGGKAVVDLGGNDTASAVVLQGDRVVVVGSTGGFFAENFAVARFTSAGTLDSSFDLDGKVVTNLGGTQATIDIANDAAVDAAGRLVVVGSSAASGSFPGASPTSIALVRYYDNGSLDDGSLGNAAFGGDGVVVTSFFDPMGNLLGSTAQAVALQSDGKIVVAGAPGALRYNADGSLDDGGADDATAGDSFGTGGKASLSIPVVNDLAILAGGDLVAVGFTVSPTPGPNAGDFAVARLDASGNSVGGVTTIDFGGFDVAQAVAVRTDGSFVVAGNPTPSATANDFELAAFKADGTLDAEAFGTAGLVTTGFIAPAGDSGTDVAVQADGKIVVAGQTFSSNQADFAVVRFNADGTLDTSFGTGGMASIDLGGIDMVAGVAVQEDGKIVVGGSSFLLGPAFAQDFAVVRFNADGTLDTSFGTGGKVFADLGGTDSAAGLALSNGKIVVVGTTLRPVAGPLPTFASDFALARFNADGSLDDGGANDGTPGDSFGTGGKVITPFPSTSTPGGSRNASALAVVALADGRLVVAGSSAEPYQFGSTALARYNPDGTLDAAFGTGGLVTVSDGSNDPAFAVVVQADGKLVTAGTAFGSPGGTAAVLRRFNANGTADEGFGESANDAENPSRRTGKVTAALGAASSGALALATQGGKVVVGGFVQTSSPAPPAPGLFTFTQSFALARYNDDGSLDAGFGDSGYVTTDFGTSSTLNGLAVQADGKLVAAGTVSNASGGDFAVARYLGDAAAPPGDADGIDTAIDLSPGISSDSFSDGNTAGTILDRGGLTVTVTDAPSPTDGVLITANGTDGTALVRVAEGTFTLTAGDQLVVTKGSVIARVVNGTVEATYVAADGQVSTATINAGIDSPTTLTFHPEDGTFFAADTNTAPVLVRVEGREVQVQAGQTLREVRVDVKLGTDLPPINLSSSGVLPVVIYSSADFDARTVDAATVRFAGAAATSWVLEDVDGDGRLDMVLKFRTQDTTLRSLYESLLVRDQNADGDLDSTRQAAEVSLTGETLSDQVFTGSDMVSLSLSGKALREALDRLFGA